MEKIEIIEIEKFDWVTLITGIAIGINLVVTIGYLRMIF